MNICFIGPFPEKKGQILGGVSNVIFYLATGLTKAGHSVNIVTTGKAPDTITDWPEFTVHVVSVPTMLPRFISNATIIKNKIHQIISQINPDICHFHGSAAYTLGYNLPYVLTLHGISELDARFSPKRFSWLRSIAVGAIEQFCRGKVPHLILINRYLEFALSNQICGAVNFIENPVDPAFFNISRSAKKNILYAGVISKRKNLLNLLRAFKIIVDQDNEVTLKIAGPVVDTYYATRCRAYISEQCLDKNVEFLGNLDISALTNQLRVSACLAITSLQETAPLVISEAMATGTPVVASNICGIPHMIENGITGFLINPQDPNEIAFSILKILQNDELALSMSKKASEQARQRFLIDTIIDHTIQIYQNILNNKPL